MNLDQTSCCVRSLQIDFNGLPIQQEILFRYVTLNKIKRLSRRKKIQSQMTLQQNTLDEVTLIIGVIAAFEDNENLIKCQ